jgi:hypothetical protein
MEARMNIDEMAKKIFEQNKAAGWWDDMDRCFLTTLQLVSTELAEATEGERKDLMDEHLPHRKMGEVELADALIRILDLAGRYGWKYNNISTTTHEFMDESVRSAMWKIDAIAGKHFQCNIYLTRLVSAKEMPDIMNELYAYFIKALYTTAESQGYDIEAAMFEKLEYNKNRADHKRENRAKEGGKKF